MYILFQGMSLPEEEFPAIFSATYEWPEWIHDPLDQRDCGASWAFSTASNVSFYSL